GKECCSHGGVIATNASPRHGSKDRDGAPSDCPSEIEVVPRDNPISSMLLDESDDGAGPNDLDDRRMLGGKLEPGAARTIEAGVGKLNDVTWLIRPLGQVAPRIGRCAVIRRSCARIGQGRCDEMGAFTGPFALPRAAAERSAAHAWSNCAVFIGDALTEMRNGIRDNFGPE